MIGDGYLDPENQLNYYDSMMHNVGIASVYTRKLATYAQTQALLKLYNGDY